MKSNSIKIKLNVFFLMVSLILFLAVGLVFYRSTKIAVNYSKEKELETLSQETGNKIERFLFERYGDIQVLSESPVLERSDIESKLKTDYLESVMKAYKTYDYILTTDDSGTVQVISGSGSGDINYKEYNDKVKNGSIYVSDFTFLPKEKVYVIYLAAPLKDSNGKIIGTVIERVNCEAIKEIVQNVKLGNTGYAFFSSSTGEYLIENQNNNKPLDTVGNNSSGISYYDYNGKKYISAYYKLTKYDSQKVNWYLFVEQSQDEAFQISNNLGSYTIMVILISIIVIFILLLYMSKGITTPFISMEQKVIKISGELEKSVMRAKNLESLAAMSAGIAHEIRNPLTSIKGYAQLIKIELGDNSYLLPDVEIIIDEVGRLNRIVDRFLSFARPKELQLKPLKINDVIKESLRIVEIEITKSNAEVTLEINETPNALVDFEEMEQVVINLILNALQAVKVNPKITVRTGYIKETNMVFIGIKDNGPGVKDEDMDKIFEPFYTTKDKGTGLGLAISSRIIENHKGYIEVKSDYGSGTEFIVKLPAI
jgi:two-component system NtrC family sensor kinase